MKPPPWIVPLALLAVATPRLALGQPAEQPIWSYRNFTSRDGLAHDVIRDVVQTADGALVFATMGGLTRYRPAQSRYESLSRGWSPRQREAMSLAIGRDGTLWVATHGGGVGAMRGGKWTWYTVAQGLPSDEISSLTLDARGRIWATPTVGGIAVFDGSTWRTYSHRDGLSSGEIGRCAALKGGDVLCGTYDAPLLQRFTGQRWSQIPITLERRRHFYVHSVTEARDGQLWLATKGAGVIRGTPDGAGGYNWTAFDRSAGLASNRVGAILEAHDGTLWLATSSGVSLRRHGRWSTLSGQDALAARQIFAITEARDGALWFTTLGSGAYRYGPNGWSRITESQGLPSDTISGGLLLARDGTRWIGTDRGLLRWPARAPSWSIERLEDHEPPPHVNDLLQERSGALWVATRRGLFERTGHGWRRHSLPHQPQQLAPVIGRLCQDRSGALWAATPAGAYRLHQGRWRAFARVDGLPSPRVHDLALDSAGQLWAATENGVARFGAERWHPALHRVPASRTNRIYSLARGDADDLWASGLEGVHRLHVGTWVAVPPNRWLPAGVYSRYVMSTEDGSLWFGVRGLGIRRHVAGRWTGFPASQATLPGDTLRDVLQLADGSYLFATLGGGLRRYQPDRAAPRTLIGPTDRGRGGVVPRAVIAGDPLVIPFSGHDALKRTPTAELSYSYRVDRGPWSRFSATPHATLSDLPPGDHLFEVRAMDRDLNIDPTPARHAFRVLRPWWREPTFIVSITLSLALILYALLRIMRAVSRERRAMLKEQSALEQRKRFVRLASHELRKPLARLAHRAELLALPSSLNDPARLSQQADAIVADSSHVSQLVETLLEQARVQDSGLRLDRRPCDLVSLVRAMVQEMDRPPEKLVLRAEISSLPVAADPFYLPLAVRNLLDNAFKYGAVPVELALSRQGSQAILLVQDHGNGIPPRQREAIFAPFYRGRRTSEHGGFGLGLSFARDIVEAHDGRLDLLPSQKLTTFRIQLSLAPSTEERNRGTSTDH